MMCVTQNSGSTACNWIPSWSLLLLTSAIVVAGCRREKSVDQSSEEQPKIAVETNDGPPKKKDRITQLCLDLNIEKNVQLFPKDEDGKIVGALLQDSRVKNIGPLKGLPLKTLQLNYTSVFDLGPIAEMPIEFLNLQATPVNDITAVKSLPLNSLWLNYTKVVDLSPLEGMTLVSLDITGTPVADLSALRGMTTLRRLNLSNCSSLKDLTPLEGLRIERLTFNPETITGGLDVVRNMTSIRKFHVKFPGREYRPADFWQSFRDGTLPRGSVGR